MNFELQEDVCLGVVVAARGSVFTNYSKTQPSKFRMRKIAFFEKKEAEEQPTKDGITNSVLIRIAKKNPPPARWLASDEDLF